MRPPLSTVFVKNDAELTVSLSCPARSEVRNRWRWRWRSVCKILSHVESLSVLTIELFMLSVQWSNVPCCPLIRYSQCLPFHWALIESFAGCLRLAGAIDISALCSLLAITFTQKLMAERTWQNLNHLVWRMQASKYPVLLLLTPDCFSILWTAAGCLIVIVCGNLTSTFCLCVSPFGSRPEFGSYFFHCLPSSPLNNFLLLLLFLSLCPHHVFSGCIHMSLFAGKTLVVRARIRLQSF